MAMLEKMPGPLTDMYADVLRYSRKLLEQRFGGPCAVPLSALEHAKRQQHFVELQVLAFAGMRASWNRRAATGTSHCGMAAPTIVGSSPALLSCASLYTE